MKVYLGGPINGCTDEEANGWRTEAKRLLEGLAHTCVDPMRRDYRGREMEPGVAEEIVDGDKRDIDSCDLILMNCPKPSVGSSMEVLYAWERDKRVVVVHPEDDKPSPWLVYHSDAIYPSVREALNAELEEAA